jgi:hypothetical protein
LPNPYLKLIISSIAGSQSSPSIEKLVFLGFVEVIILCVGVFYSLLSRGKKFYLFLFALFLVPFSLSLGFGKGDNLWFLPYHFLSNLFPFSLIPETGRYYVVFNFFIAIIIVLLLDKLSIKKRSYFLIIIIVFLILERLPSNYYLAPSLKNASYQNAVRLEKSAAVLDLPINFYYPNYDIISFYYNKPIVNGYFHWSADSDKEKSFVLTNNLLTRYICDQNDPLQNSQIDNFYEAASDAQMLSLLKENGINTIVVHKDDKFYHSVCKSFRKRLNRLLSLAVSITSAPIAEKQIIQKYGEGKSSLTLYFPQDGNFYLDGVYIAPSGNTSIDITLDKQPLTNYSWSIRNDYSMEILPKYSISFPVKAGSRLSLSSSRETNSTYFSVWYRYAPDNDVRKILYKPPLEKIFEDDTVEVYRLK